MAVNIPQTIANASSAAGIPSQLALEVAIQESNLNPSAVSPAGAIGVMQLMPATAAQLGVDPTDPTQNIYGGVSYLASLFNQFGSWAQALAAYNWGPGKVSTAVANYGDNWLSTAPQETQNYVGTILSNAGMTDDPSASASPYSAVLTPSSIANGISSADSSTIFLLTLAAIGIYFLADLVFE